MKKALITAGVLTSVLVLVMLGTCRRDREEAVDTEPRIEAPSLYPEPTAPSEAHRGLLYGRVSTLDGAAYEGRLRFGGDEEASWSDYFNGYKDRNPWAVHVPAKHLEVRRPITVFGVRIVDRVGQIDLERPFMVRFGDIERIEARGRRILVTLKSGTVFDLDRLNADDLADGVRVWDSTRGVVDLGERRIESIELLPTRLSSGPERLHGTVRTRQGEFTGFVQWNRQASIGTDELAGETADSAVSLRFDTIRSIERNPGDSSTVTLLDGQVLMLTGTRDVGSGNQGVYVDDPRYGRVLVSWRAFERLDFSPGDSGLAYDDFPPGSQLTGRVTTHDGRRLDGRLVYDLDESETTETLDAPLHGVNYTIPFGLIASIVLSDREGRPRVTLHSGEVLELERSGDLGDGNAGLLVFTDGAGGSEYVLWRDILKVELDRPSDVPAGQLDDAAR